MWRGILIFLALLWTLSAVAGVWLGQALTDSAPLRPDATTERFEAAAGSILAGLPEPPQPRMDGSLGLVNREPIVQQADTVLVSALENTASSVSMSTIVINPEPSGSGPDPARLLAGLDNGNPSPGGTNDGALVIPGLNAMLGDMPSGPGTPAAPAGPNWQGQLRQGLASCANHPTYSPPECEQRLRQQYCTPNDAWGQVPECPGFLRNLRL